MMSVVGQERRSDNGQLRPRRAIASRLIFAKWLHSCSILLASEARRGARAIANYRRMICRFVVLLAIVGVGGCSASRPEPTLQTAYSAIGAQVK
jgi:hypothetical protein